MENFSVSSLNNTLEQDICSCSCAESQILAASLAAFVLIMILIGMAAGGGE